MRSVPRAVATGSPLSVRIENSRIVTRSLPLSVLTPQQSFCKLRHHSAIGRRAFDDRLCNNANLPSLRRIDTSKRREASDIDRAVFHLHAQISIVLGDVQY